MPGLYRVLEERNERLKSDNRRVLLAIDEYEVIDRKIKERVLPTELLDTLRESIQSHRQITWLLAGSHRIAELSNANWTSYFVSARTVEVGPFSAGETHLLLTEPLKYSELWSEDSRRPRFAASFWGDGGIERIHAESGGWPALVQLIAETAIDVVNNEDAQSVSKGLMDRALQQAIVKGDTVLSQLMRGESTLPGEWEYIAAFRRYDQQRPPEDNAVYESLRNREIMTEENGYWRLRVPLMARWLLERG